MSLLRAATGLIPLVVLLLLVSVPASAQEAKVDEEPSMSPNAGPLRVFKSVERAWLAGDAQAIANLASGSRVYVEIRGIDRGGGHYTKPQIFYIFRNMFASTDQMNFTFVKYFNIEKPEGRIYGMALRTYKKNQSGGLYKDKVFVTLVKEGSRWAVAEIKSTW